MYITLKILQGHEIKVDRLAGDVTSMRLMRNKYTILVGEPEGKRPEGRPRRRQEGNFKKQILKNGSQAMNWICLAGGQELASGPCEHGH